MSLATMADRSLPLAERVNAAYLVGIRVADGDENGRDARAALDALRADIAAADRLARAAEGWFAAIDGWTSELSVNLRYADIDASLAAYRARMAQGVGDG